MRSNPNPHRVNQHFKSNVSEVDSLSAFLQQYKQYLVLLLGILCGILSLYVFLVTVLKETETFRISWVIWSPDSSQFLFATLTPSSSQNVECNVYRTQAKSWKTEHMPLISKNCSWPVWSNDGQKFAVISEHNYLREIALIDAKTGDVDYITANVRIEYNLTWSPDNKSIAFLANYFDKTQLFVVDIETKQQELIFEWGRKNLATNIRWTIDNQHLFFNINKREYHAQQTPAGWKIENAQVNFPLTLQPIFYNMIYDKSSPNGEYKSKIVCKGNSSPVFPDDCYTEELHLIDTKNQKISHAIDKHNIDNKLLWGLHWKITGITSLISAVLSGFLCLYTTNAIISTKKLIRGR